MARSYLIDGYNALHKLAQPPPEGVDACRRFLVDRVRAVLRGRTAPKSGGDRVHVVFDARAGDRVGTHGRDGAVSWSYADGSADDAIVDLARRNEGTDDGRDLVVVTDDRELRGRAKQLGCLAMRVHEYFADAGDDAPSDAPTPGRSPGLRASDFRADDFGLPAEIDLDAVDPDDL